MSKRVKVVFGVIAVVAGLGVLHLWQNVGFENLGLGGAKQVADEKRFRVGFLPVT